jgi:transcriptional regulator with XRE-family HTH domain
MTDASQVGARILRDLRRGRGWSWQEQARLLKRLAEPHGVERIAAATTESISRTIARWESGRYPYKPDERYQLLLAYAYAIRDGEAAVAPGSDLDHLMVALGEMGVSLDADRSCGRSRPRQRPLEPGRFSRSWHLTTRAGYAERWRAPTDSTKRYGQPTSFRMGRSRRSR